MSAVPKPARTKRNLQRIQDRDKPCQQWLKGNCQLGSTCKFRHTVSLTESHFKQSVQKEDSETNEAGSAPKLGGSASLIPSTSFVLAQTTSTESKVAESSRKGKEKKVTVKKEGNNIMNQSGSSSEILPCGGWKLGTCARGNKCPYGHGSSQGRITQVPTVQVVNEPFQSQNVRGNNSARRRKPTQAEKTTKASKGLSTQNRNLTLPQSGRSRKEDVLERLKAAMDDAREGGQRGQQGGPFEDENQHKEEALERERAEREAMQQETARMEEDNRRRELIIARAKEAKARSAKEAREAAKREQLALIEEENRRKEEAMEKERVEREARQREAALREEENRRREEAKEKEAKAKAAKEAREREQLALIEEENRRKEEAMERERVEREARQRAAALREEENRRREEAIAKEKDAKEKAAEEAREAAKREQLALIEEENRRKEAMERERIEREARQREAALREENRRREEAIAKKKEAKAKAKEARETRKRDQALKREAKRRETEARIAREKAEQEAREEAEKRRQLEIAAQREKEAAAVEQYLVSESCLVTFSAGFDIQHVIPGFELCRIVIKNLPRNAKPEEIVDIFIQQGVQRAEFLLFEVKVIGKKQEAVVLANAEQGEAISLGLDGIEFRDEVLSFSVSDNASWSTSGMAAPSIPFIIVSWRIPGETVVVNYSSMEEARRKIGELDKKTWNGRQINAKTNDPPRHGGSRNFVLESIKLFNCPLGSAVDKEFFEFVGSSNIRALKSNTSFNLQESFDLLRRHIAGKRGVRINTYQILKRGDQVDGEVKIKVEFDDWENAKLAHVTIDKQRMGIASPFYHCWLPKQLQYKIVIPRHQYDSQKKQWDALGEKKAVNDPYVQARIGDRGGVFIEIVGKEKEAAGPLKVRVENMIAGEKLDPTFWHPSFTLLRSKGFFERLYKGKKVFVRCDFKTQSVRVYGESNAVEEARQMIKGEVERLGQMETTRVLNREWVGFFVREGVGKLEELLGEENVKLDVQWRICKITIKGGEEANHYLQRLIDQARAAVVVDSVLPGASEAETCPVCYGDISHPEQLGCGHSYCSGCLKHFLTSAVDNKTFPLLCVGNEASCNVPVAIPFIHRFLPAQTFNNLIEAAFHAYLEQHQRDLKYCSTPDCKQIYRRRTDKPALQCPACFSAICPSCDAEPHSGMTCEEQRIHRNPAEQERLNEELAASNGYKRCPSCSAMIEKTEGCNHMTCNCKAHICWKCMNVFETAQETYNHLRTVHGGYDDEDPVGVVVGNAPCQDFLAEQVEALARIERERVAQERFLRPPMVVAVNPFVDPIADGRAQLVGEEIRRARAMANVQQWRARAAADVEEEERRAREAAYAQELARRAHEAAYAQELARRARAVADAEEQRRAREAARAATEAEEQARRVRVAAYFEEEQRRRARAEYDAKVAEARQARLTQEQEEDRGWCILM